MKDKERVDAPPCYQPKKRFAFPFIREVSSVLVNPRGLSFLHVSLCWSHISEQGEGAGCVGDPQGRGVRAVTRQVQVSGKREGKAGAAPV